MDLADHIPGRAIRRALSFALAVLVACTLTFAAPAKKKPASKQSARSKTARTVKSKAAKTGKKTVRTRRAGARKSRSRRPSWRNTQMRPTPERYKEIQRALIAKGFLQGEASGVWDESSIDALRRFQADQNLEATGKIDSLSLIALGLGPSYRASAQQTGTSPNESPQN